MNTRDLVSKSGATYRQIDYWETIGWLVQDSNGAKGTGNRRSFADRELGVARLLKTLSDNGMLGMIPSNVAFDEYDKRLYVLMEKVRQDGLKGVVSWDKDNIVKINLTAIAKKYI